jgi:hypothetical protein
VYMDVYKVTHITEIEVKEREVGKGNGS